MGIRLPVAALSAAVALISAGCGADGQTPAARPTGTTSSPSATTTSPVSPAPSPEPSSPGLTTAQLLEGSQAVQFRTSDGIRLDGRLFGTGTAGVVLSHQGGTAANQSDWWGMARVLADRGYRVLTYDFRGICPGGVKGCSGGRFGGRTQWKDLVAAVGFIRTAGAKRVAVAGASIGAMASLVVAGMHDQDIAAVISLSGGEDLSGIYELRKGPIRRISAPKLFVAGSTTASSPTPPGTGSVGPPRRSRGTSWTPASTGRTCSPWPVGRTPGSPGSSRG